MKQRIVFFLFLLYMNRAVFASKIFDQTNIYMNGGYEKQNAAGLLK